MTSNFFILAVLIVLLFGASSAVWAQQGTVLSRDFVHIEDTENLDLSKGVCCPCGSEPGSGIFLSLLSVYVPQEMDYRQTRSFEE